MRNEDDLVRVRSQHLSVGDYEERNWHAMSEVAGEDTEQCLSWTSSSFANCERDREGG